MFKHQYLVNKYTERVDKSFIKLSADSAFSFLGIGSKMKTWNWQKMFYSMFYCKLDFPNFKQRYQRSSRAALIYIAALKLG